MKTANLSTQATRMSDVGLVWRLLNNATADSQEVPKYSALYIKAIADCIVTIDGIDAVKLLANDSIIINAGPGNPTDNKQTVTIAFSGGVNCSVADEKTRKI